VRGVSGRDSDQVRDGDKDIDRGEDKGGIPTRMQESEVVNPSYTASKKRPEAPSLPVALVCGLVSSPVKGTGTGTKSAGGGLGPTRSSPRPKLTPAELLARTERALEAVLKMRRGAAGRAGH